METDSGGNALASYVLADTRLVSQERSSTSHYYLTDGQHSVRALSNGSAVTTDTYDYTAFGTSYQDNGSTTNPYRFTGQQFDVATGLYSLRARYYDPLAGRFLSRDTWPIYVYNPIELNRYGYTANSPINYIDPSGHSLVETSLAKARNTIATRAAAGAAGGFVFSSLFVLLANSGACGKQRFSTNDALLFIGMSTLFGAGFGAIGGVIKALPFLYPTISAVEAKMLGAAFNAGMGLLALLQNENEGLCGGLVDAAGVFAFASGTLNFFNTGFNNLGGGSLQPSAAGANGGSYSAPAIGANPGVTIIPTIGVDGVAGTTIAANATAHTASNPPTPPGGSGGGGSNTTPNGTKWTHKNATQAGNRGWSDTDIDTVLDSPAATSAAPRGNLKTGNPATIFYQSDGHYVIRDDVTGDIVQYSNTNDPNWIDEATGAQITSKP